MKPLDDCNTIAAKASSSVKGGGYCNCEGFLMSLGTRGDTSGIRYEKADDGYVFLEDMKTFYALRLAGKFSNPISVTMQSKPIIFTHIRGEMPVLCGFGFYRETMCMVNSSLCPPESRLCAVSAELNQITDIMLIMQDNLESADLPTEQELEKFIKDGSCFVLVSGNVIFGTACAPVVGARCQIAHVAVSNEYRRNGAGKALIGACLGYAAAKGARSASLWVDCKNTAAEKLYRSTGFEIKNKNTTQWILPAVGN